MLCIICQGDLARHRRVALGPSSIWLDRENAHQNGSPLALCSTMSDNCHINVETVRLT